MRRRAGVNGSRPGSPPHIAGLPELAAPEAPRRPAGLALFIAAELLQLRPRRAAAAAFAEVPAGRAACRDGPIDRSRPRAGGCRNWRPAAPTPTGRGWMEGRDGRTGGRREGFSRWDGQDGVAGRMEESMGLDDERMDGMTERDWEG